MSTRKCEWLIFSWSLLLLIFVAFNFHCFQFSLATNFHSLPILFAISFLSSIFALSIFPRSIFVTPFLLTFLHIFLDSFPRISWQNLEDSHFRGGFWRRLWRKNFRKRSKCCSYNVEFRNATRPKCGPNSKVSKSRFSSNKRWFWRKVSTKNFEKNSKSSCQ